MHNHNL